MKLRVFSLVGFLCVGAFFAWVFMATEPPETNFHKIQMGMTGREVEGILGTPTDELQPGAMLWIGREHSVIIFFDSNNVVVDKNVFVDKEFTNYYAPSLWQRILEWFGSRRVEAA